MTFRHEYAKDRAPREAMSTQTSRSTRSATSPTMRARVFLALQIELALDADRVQRVVRRIEGPGADDCPRRTRERFKQNRRRQVEGEAGERRELHAPEVLAHRALAPRAARAFDRDRARLGMHGLDHLFEFIGHLRRQSPRAPEPAG